MKDLSGKLNLAALWKKYRLVLLVVLAGVLLMLLPSHSDTQTSSDGNIPHQSERFSLKETEERMEEMLRTVEGTGELRLMLTLQSTSRLQLAEDTDYSQREGESRSEQSPLKLHRGSGTEDVVVTQQEYPIYQGAVVVCQGADDPQVCLAVTEAVCALTGLRSDKVSVIKWKS